MRSAYTEQRTARGDQWQVSTVQNLLARDGAGGIDD